MGPRSSGDRALPSGGRCRRFESCRGHAKHGQRQRASGWYSKTPSGCECQPLSRSCCNGRKTDPVDAHSVTSAALRAPNLVRVQADPELVVMAMLVDRRDELGRARTQTAHCLHRLLLELFPGGAKKFLSATQARVLVATIKPRDIVGKTRPPDKPRPEPATTKFTRA